LLLLRDIFAAVPSETPNRLDVIQSFFDDVYDNEDNSKYIVIDIGDKFSEAEYNNTQETLAKISQYINVLSPLPEPDVEIETVLLPTQHFCCKRLMRIDGRYHATITLFTEDGKKCARTYHANCKTCGTVHYHGFAHNKRTNERTYDIRKAKHFVLTTGVAFSIKLLQNFTHEIFIGSVSFESLAEIYNAKFDLKEEKLNDTRIEAAWYIFHMIPYIKSFNWHRKASKEIDIEKISLDVYETIRKTVDDKWINHVCDEIGCKNRYIVMDGNEKNFRLICGLERHKIAGEEGQVNSYDICIRDPIRGNQHTKPSKCCTEHQQNMDKMTNQETLDFKRITRSMAKDIPPTVTSGEGCKEDDKVDRFHMRTAGMMYMFRSCGVRLSHWEMYTSESLSTAFTCLVDLFADNPEALRGLVYDRACDLHPFVKRLAAEGNVYAKMFVNMPYIVDIFHAEKHTMAKCTLSHPDCEYHPHLAKHEAVRSMNTEIAEQSFSRINPFKYMTRRMTYGRRLVFLKLLDNYANERITQRRKSGTA
jgi:hypothetical protein